MCGIVGVVTTGQSGQSKDILPALETMKLRGPDDFGVWQDSWVVLGHRRLSVVDIKRGHQPICSPDGSIVIVINGELYDNHGMRQNLANEYDFQTDSDSEMLIPLYLKYGYREMMNYLRGEFAFILYDQRKGIVMAARDRFGIKPLCWYQDAEQIIIASKAKAILACGVKAEWDQYSLMQSLSMHYQPTDRTFFKNIRQVEPGHMLVSTLDNGKTVDTTYWDLDYPACDDYSPLTSDQEREYVDEFHDMLMEAIRIRTRGDVPVCCHLSGGLDSSTVAGMLAHLQKEPIHCFSIVFPQADSEYDEDAFASETVKKCGGVMHRIEVSQQDILRHLSDAVHHTEGLAVNGHLTCKYLLNKKIQEAGFKVALTGEGADECLAGYPHLRKDVISMLPQKERETLVEKLYKTNLSITGTEISFGETLDCSALSRRLGLVPSFLAAKAGIGFKMYRLLAPEMLLYCSRHDFFDELLDHYNIDVQLKGRHVVNQSLYLWNKLTLSNYILSTLGDGCEMSASVEGRLPFLDHPLFEYAARLPMQLKIKDYVNEKYILKEAARPYVTNRVYRRQKHPFQAPPLTRFFSRSDIERIHDELTSLEFLNMGFFNEKAVSQLVLSLQSMSVIEQTAYEPVVMLMLTIHYMNQRLLH